MLFLLEEHFDKIFMRSGCSGEQVLIVRVENGESRSGFQWWKKSKEEEKKE